MDLMIQFQEDTELAIATDDELKLISKLALAQMDSEFRVNYLEDELSVAKEQLKNIQERLLPEAMAAVGMTEFKMNSGVKISIKNDVYASIRKDYLSQAVKWLDENGLGGIVKDQVSVDFGRGELRSVEFLMNFCKQYHLVANEKLNVHPSTLKATIKEQLAKGVEFPEEFFSIAPVSKATIKTK